MNASTQAGQSILVCTRFRAEPRRAIDGWTIAGISALLIALFAMAVQVSVPQTPGADGAGNEVSSVLQ